MPFTIEKAHGILVCPECHSVLVQDADALVCTNPIERLRYPVLDGIPRLLKVEADVLTQDAWQAVMVRAGRAAE